MQSTFVLDAVGGDVASTENAIIYDSALGSVDDKSDQNSTPRKSVENNRNFRKFTNVKRYHENEKLSRFKPGVLSSDLRDALGISANQIPLHVYRMRSMGYPPGWLNRAKVDELPSFDAKASLTKCESVAAYDERAFIKYPGFNVYDGNLRDEYRELRCPRLQENFLLENFIKTLLENPTAKTDRVPATVENEDLDVLMKERQRILSEINALESTLAQKSPSSPGTKESSDVKASSKSNDDHESASGSITDHEESNSNLPSSDVVASEDSENSSRTETEEKTLEIEESNGNLEIEDGTIIPINLSKLVEDSDDDDSNVKFEPSALLTAQQKVPDLEAFSHGIQPYQPFENLPNAQGGYNRVRETLLRAKNDPSFFQTPSADQTQPPPARSPLLETPSSPDHSNGSSHAPSRSRNRFSSGPWHISQQRLTRRESEYPYQPVQGRRHAVEPHRSSDRWAPPNGYGYFQNAPPVNRPRRFSYGDPYDVRRYHRNDYFNTQNRTSYHQYSNNSHSRYRESISRYRGYRY